MKGKNIDLLTPPNQSLTRKCVLFEYKNPKSSAEKNKEIKCPEILVVGSLINHIIRHYDSLEYWDFVPKEIDSIHEVVYCNKCSKKFQKVYEGRRLAVIKHLAEDHGLLFARLRKHEEIEEIKYLATIDKKFNKIYNEVVDEKFEFLKLNEYLSYKPPKQNKIAKNKASQLQGNAFLMEKVPYSENGLENVWHIIGMTSSNHIFECPACTEKFESKGSLIEHQKSMKHEYAIYDVETWTMAIHMHNKTSEESKVEKEAIQKKKAKPFKCIKCDYKCEKKSTYNQHVKTHDKDLKCPHCEKLFCRNTNMKRHIKRHQNDKCLYCNEKFLKKIEREIHINEKHKDLRTKYSCEICNKEYVRKNSLKEHKKTKHEDEKPKCKICHKEFASNLTAKRHTDKMH